MKQKSIIFAGMALLFLLTAFTSCEKDDDSWTPMEWRYNGQKIERTSTFNQYSVNQAFTFQVGAEGGEFDFECLNYKRVWPADIQVEGEVADSSQIISPSESEWKKMQETGIYTLSSEWTEAIGQDSYFKVTIKPNTTGKERTVSVYATAGNIFTGFTFEQAK